MTYIHPHIHQKLGLGVGMDLPWNYEIGFQTKTDDITDKMYRFFQAYSDDFNYMFLAFQPKNQNALSIEDYILAYDRLFEAASPISYRAFHHTMLNMGTAEPYSKQYIADFTNALIERYNFQWIVEDLGIWSLQGKSLPYPLPPFLNQEGLDACIRNVFEWKALLNAPISIEFPGFTEGSNFYIGHMHAFEFFKTVVEATDCLATIDIGHILSYQWLIGRKNSLMYEDLNLLPLNSCFELHLSGCAIQNGKFRDMHHGVLMDEQIDLLSYFLENCPNLKAITYEDPKYDMTGKLILKSRHNYARLKNSVQQWKEKVS